MDVSLCPIFPFQSSLPPESSPGVSNGSSQNWNPKETSGPDGYLITETGEMGV